MKPNPLIKIFRVLAFVVLVTGAVASICLVLRMGHNNKSSLLIALFVIWVSSSFIALLLSNIISGHWPVRPLIFQYSLSIILTLFSLAYYNGNLVFEGRKPAFAFLIVPLISWLIIVISIQATILLSRISGRRNGSTE